MGKKFISVKIIENKGKEFRFIGEGEVNAHLDISKLRESRKNNFSFVDFNGGWAFKEVLGAGEIKQEEVISFGDFWKQFRKLTKNDGGQYYEVFNWYRFLDESSI